MTKQDLVRDIADTTGLDRVAVARTLEAFIILVDDAVSGGEDVFLRGFGTFKRQKQKSRLGWNMKTHERIPIPERFVPDFKPSPVFKKNVIRKGADECKN